MLSEIERDALEDIRDNIVRVMRFVHGLDLRAFSATTKAFTPLRAASKLSPSRRLSPAFKERFPAIP
jgi:hypothetical protein